MAKLSRWSKLREQRIHAHCMTAAPKCCRLTTAKNIVIQGVLLSLNIFSFWAIHLASSLEILICVPALGDEHKLPKKSTAGSSAYAVPFYSYYSSPLFSNTANNIVLLSYCGTDFGSRILNNTLILS